VKKLLIIQQDEAYFLFETIQVLEKYASYLKDFEPVLLVDPKAYSEVYKSASPLLTYITTDPKKIQTSSFDVSVNLSLRQESWQLHGEVNSQRKIGPFLDQGYLRVEDNWSSYFITLRASAPFLTFHLQDFYRNILGLKGIVRPADEYKPIRQFAYGATALKLFSANEQEKFIHELAKNHPLYPIRDITEIDLISDVSDALYIGPATLEALKFCEAGGRAIFLSSHFKGFNFVPYSEGHLLLSSRGGQFEAPTLLRFVEHHLRGELDLEIPYSLYAVDHENMFGAYLNSLNTSDDNFPFYQSHVVLWNFLLNLFDTNLEITRCTQGQLQLLKDNHAALKKFLRLHDYAMVSVDTIYQEAKSQSADGLKIDGHLKNLSEIDAVTERLAETHAFLRPVLDFYKIRKGQNTGDSLPEISQSSLLTYSEEHQALMALDELFSVTLRKNEVNI
jgi:hypothetical protein